MRRTVLLVVLFGFILAVPTLAEARIVTKINLSSQRMAVIVDGKAR